LTWAEKNIMEYQCTKLFEPYKMVLVYH
jgi:hypothetical protein